MNLSALTPDSADVLPVLSAQLERMRSMMYGYYSQFFNTIAWSLILTIGLLVISLHPNFRYAVMIVPFFIIFVGAYTAYLYTYVRFARNHAAALEQVINTRLDGEWLVAHKLEAAYFGSELAPHLTAFNFHRPASFLSAITLNFGIGGGLLFLVAAWRAVQVLPDALNGFFPLWLYIPLLIVWTLVNIGYIAWRDISGRDEAQVRQLLSQAYAKQGVQIHWDS